MKLFRYSNIILRAARRGQRTGLNSVLPPGIDFTKVLRNLEWLKAIAQRVLAAIQSNEKVSKQQGITYIKGWFRQLGVQPASISKIVAYLESITIEPLTEDFDTVYYTMVSDIADVLEARCEAKLAADLRLLDEVKMPLSPLFNANNAEAEKRKPKKRKQTSYQIGLAKIKSAIRKMKHA